MIRIVSKMLAAFTILGSRIFAFSSERRLHNIPTPSGKPIMMTNLMIVSEIGIESLGSSGAKRLAAKFAINGIVNIVTVPLIAVKLTLSATSPPINGS